ncbi:MAG: tetratricopeptide repeat protein [Chloroflexi bacterium]|nr:tetratricopeptide repeat protein [Chloroflexota bacterium]
MAINYEQAGNLGHSFIWDQRWEDAVKAFQIAISGQPNEPTLYDGLAMAYRGLNQLDKALENYQMAARLAKGDPIYLEQVADVQSKLGHHDQAAQTYMAIGEFKLRDRKIDEAMDKWIMAVQLNPNLLNAHKRLASVYERQNQPEQAINEYLIVGRLYEEQGAPGLALESCQAALKLAPRNAEILTAIEQLQHGEKAFAAETAQSRPQSRAKTEEKPKKKTIAPVEDAQRIARERMAAEIFADDADEMMQMKLMGFITKALDFQTRGVTAEAIQSYEQALKSGMSSNAAHFNLGLLYQEQLRYEEAIKQFEISVRDPEYRLASHFGLGEAHRAVGRIDKAVEHFITVLKIVDLATVKREQADRLIELYESLADSLMTRGDRDRAMNFSSALVDFLSNKGWENEVKEARRRLDAMSAGSGTMILGDILTAGSSKVLEALYRAQEISKRGLHGSAIEEVYRAIELTPNYLPAHMLMAELLVKQQRIGDATQKFLVLARSYQVRGDLNGAIHAYERAVEAAPTDVSTRGKLIGMLKSYGHIDKAIEQYIGMGQAYYQMAQPDRARETYAEALKLAPRGTTNRKWQVQLLRLVGDLDMQRLDWRRALPVYRELRRVDPEDERAAISLVDLLFKTNDPENALKELDRYLVHLAKSGRGGKVVGILEDVFNQRPSDANIGDRLARLYVQQKKVAKAIEVFDKLGEAQLDAGQKKAAVVTIKKILSLNPPNRQAYEQLLAQIS